MTLMSLNYWLSGEWHITCSRSFVSKVDKRVRTLTHTVAATDEPGVNLQVGIWPQSVFTELASKLMPVNLF